MGSDSERQDKGHPALTSRNIAVIRHQRNDHRIRLSRAITRHDVSMEPSHSVRKRAREKPETGRTLKHKQRHVHFRQGPDCGQKDEWRILTRSRPRIGQCSMSVMWIWSVMRDANDANRQLRCMYAVLVRQRCTCKNSKEENGRFRYDDRPEEKGELTRARVYSGQCRVYRSRYWTARVNSVP